MNSMQTCNFVMFYFRKNYFSDISGKCILQNMMGAMGVILSRKVRGDDPWIFSRATQKLLYRRFLPNVSPSLQHLNGAYQKESKSGSKSGGGTKHSLSPRGKKLGGGCPPPSPTKLCPWTNQCLQSRRGGMGSFNNFLNSDVSRSSLHYYFT